MPRRTAALRKVFELLGFKAIAKHRHKDVTLYRQGGVNFLINAEPDSFNVSPVSHAVTICAIRFRVRTRSQRRALAPGLGLSTAARSIKSAILINRGEGRHRRHQHL